MGQLTDDLNFMYSESAFGTQTLTYGAVTVAGYFDQEENISNDVSGDALLVKRTVFRIKTPLASTPMASCAANSSVTVHDPETDTDTSYVVADKELLGDGMETRLVLMPA